MREKIAKAAYVAQNKDDDWIFHEEDGAVKSEYRAIADAVLDALMEPTVGMIWSGWERQMQGPRFVDAKDRAASIFTAMIRAAKEGN